MKTVNALICIAIVVAMTIPATAAIPPGGIIDIDDGWESGADLFVHESIIFLDGFTGEDDEVYCLLYDLEYDCAFWANASFTRFIPVMEAMVQETGGVGDGSPPRFMPDINSNNSLSGQYIRPYELLGTLRTRRDSVL